MTYVLQRGDDHPPRELTALPADVPSCEPGAWHFSELLRGWIGCSLGGEENWRIYQERIARA